jgi:hypothetical protein
VSADLHGDGLGSSRPNQVPDATPAQIIHRDRPAIGTRESDLGTSALIASPQFLVGGTGGTVGAFRLQRGEQLGEELVGYHQSRVHRQHWHESGNYDRSCRTRIYI